MNSREKKSRRSWQWMAAFLLITIAALAWPTVEARAAGTLTPKNSEYPAVQIKDHQVNITINNGFAMTEVVQTFFNPNAMDIEALYSFPLPKSASLSEVTITSGDTEINGEVLPKKEARDAYENEKQSGNDAGLAEKNEFYSFEFSVYPVRAGQETVIRFLYYQPLEIEMGVGRYLYPLEEGGTDEVAEAFWSRNEVVEELFSITAEVKSAAPLDSVRVPGFSNSAVVEKKDEGHYLVTLQEQHATLDRDFVLYYRLVPDLPGRVELVPYRASHDGPGTFMMVVTPGMDLQPITGGADYLFVLDISGSMNAKIGTLANAVSQSLGKLSGEDRFRVVTFSSGAKDLTAGWVNATEQNVLHYARKVEALETEGGTNIYKGLKKALGDLEENRATSLILVTDGVTNQGVVDPKKFHELMKQYDIRVFGFLLGNSGNWPLMRTICNASGGFYAGVSNADDMVGQIMLARSKVTYECLHDASLKISGVKVFDASDEMLGKVYRGQQLVIFGRYDQGGEAEVTFKGRMTSGEKTYRTSFSFPDIDESCPEVERLYALNRIEHLEDMINAGLIDGKEADSAIRNLGLAYQLVTDQTSMVVLTDETFEQLGIERHNRRRIERERAARAQRAGQTRSQRVDTKSPMFKRSSPSHGGGAFDPLSAAAALGAAFLSIAGWRRSRSSRSSGRRD